MENYTEPKKRNFLISAFFHALFIVLVFIRIPIQLLSTFLSPLLFILGLLTWFIVPDHYLKWVLFGSSFGLFAAAILFDMLIAALSPYATIFEV